MNQYLINAQEQEPKKRNRRSVIYLVLILALALLGSFLNLKNRELQKQLTIQSKTFTIDSLRFADLDDRFHAEMDSLYSYKGQNATLDSLLNIKIKKLAGMEKSLAVARSTKKMDDSYYEKNLADLDSMTDDMKNQIAEMQQQNGILNSKNDSLGKNIAESATTSQQLTQMKATLTTKLARASLLMPVNTMSGGIKVNASGKETTTSKIKKAKRIRVAFDIPATIRADSGSKTFYLVLTDTKGTVLTDPAQGSGVFQTAENATQQQYTTSKTISFNKLKQHVEMEWSSTTAFVKGDYTAEIYQDGYLTDKSVIKLK